MKSLRICGRAIVSRRASASLFKMEKRRRRQQHDSRRKALLTFFLVISTSFRIFGYRPEHFTSIFILQKATFVTKRMLVGEMAEITCHWNFHFDTLALGGVLIRIPVRSLALKKSGFQTFSRRKKLVTCSPYLSLTQVLGFLVETRVRLFHLEKRVAA